MSDDHGVNDSKESDKSVRDELRAIVQESKNKIIEEKRKSKELSIQYHQQRHPQYLKLCEEKLWPDVLDRLYSESRKGSSSVSYFLGFDNLKETGIHPNNYNYDFKTAKSCLTSYIHFKQFSAKEESFITSNGGFINIAW